MKRLSKRPSLSHHAAFVCAAAIASLSTLFLTVVLPLASAGALA